jgi:hypothetical protein
MYQTLPDAATLARLHDQAKTEASRLRGEAVDEFWRGADAIWQRGLHGGEALAQRSAARLRASLARHARSRNTAVATPRTSTGV